MTTPSPAALPADDRAPDDRAEPPPRAALHDVSARAPSLTVTTEATSAPFLVDAAFLDVATHRAPFVEVRHVEIGRDDAPVSPPGFEVVRRCGTEHSTRELASDGETFVLTIAYDRSRRIEVASTSAARCAAVTRSIVDGLPSQLLDGRVELISLHESDGVQRRWRQVAAPSWDEVRGSYPDDVAEAFGRLVARTRDDVDRGGLVLLHGPPGTGKTTALRALIREWEPWCEPQLVVDQSDLFSDVNYVAEVLESQPSRTPDHLADVGPDDRRRLRLLIAEDCDDVLHTDANGATDTRLGRLLNLTDGLLGQDERTLLVLTTNDRLDRLHPAIARPGRCLASIGFRPFDRAEARARVPDSRAVPGPMTLAEILRENGTLETITTPDRSAATVGNYL